VIINGPTALGQSGRVSAEEYIAGFVLDTDWAYLYGATVEIYTKINCTQSPPAIPGLPPDEEGIMTGRVVIEAYGGAGTLELQFASRISGPGGFIFDGRWTVVEATGIFDGIQANGTLSNDPVYGLPMMSGVYH